MKMQAIENWSPFAKYENSSQTHVYGAVFASNKVLPRFQKRLCKIPKDKWCILLKTDGVEINFWNKWLRLLQEMC